VIPRQSLRIVPKKDGLIVKILSPKTEYEFFGLLLVSMILSVPQLHLEKLTH
jgi:hypothetical protein